MKVGELVTVHVYENYLSDAERSFTYLLKCNCHVLHSLVTFMMLLRFIRLSYMSLDCARKL